MLFRFTCETVDCHYNENPAYLIDATETVLCGACGVVGVSELLTNEQISELDLPVTNTSNDGEAE